MVCCPVGDSATSSSTDFEPPYLSLGLVKDVGFVAGEMLTVQSDAGSSLHWVEEVMMGTKLKLLPLASQPYPDSTGKRSSISLTMPID